MLLFTAVDCPISNAYAPEVARLHADYAERGVGLLLVYSEPGLAADRIRRHVADYAYPVPARRDPELALARSVGASVTPEAAVLSPAGELLYRGRIDDRYLAFGQARREPGRRDLREALEAVLAGRPVAVPRTEAVGCSLPEAAR